MTTTMTADPRLGAGAEGTPASGVDDVTMEPPRRRRNLLMRVALGREGDPRWARPSLWALLLATAVLYFYRLTQSGYANEFYAASVKSATKSFTAWLFASLDSANSITVDKPPAAIWVMGLSARIFGFSSFSLLLPQALMGVGTVALTYAAVRRFSGHVAGLVAGAIVALTPVAALMFKFDNPDALLALSMTAACYMVVRAIETSRGRRALFWLLGAGWLLGLAFLTKMLQGLLVLPGLGLAYLVAAPRSWWTRVWHLLAAAASLVASAGWFIALVSLWPASSRPYIGGSTNNSLWELAIGYNGLSRVLGGEGNAGGGGGQNSGFGGTAGWLRMFNSAFGAEISWLLPAAAILLVAGLVAAGRRPLSDRPRAALILWGGALLTTAGVFSFMQGTVHPYYAVALAPLIGATVAVGGKRVWDRTSTTGLVGVAWRTVLALAVAVTAGWGFHLMATQAPSWHPALRWIAVIAGIAGAIGFVVGGLDLHRGGQRLRLAAASMLMVGSVGAILPTTAWTVATAASAHSGSIPTSGPSGAGSGMGGGGMGGFGGTRGSMTGAPGQNGTSSTTSQQPPSGQAGPTGQSGTTIPGGSTNQSVTGSTGGTATSDGQGGSNAELVALLNKAGTTWSAAVIGDQTAAGYILNTNTAVFCIGGWSGSDNNVTLAQFEQYVAEGRIHYFIAGGGMGGGGGMGAGSTSASAITSWVTSTFKSTTVGGTTVYDLTTKA